MIDKITIHCSVTKNGKEVTPKTINKWHTDRGFRRVGYHFLIQPNGHTDGYHNSSNYMRPLNMRGAHVKGHNKNNIGICLIGTNKFTKKQFWTLYKLISELKTLYSIDMSEIYGHYEFSAYKTCPNIRMSCLILFLCTGVINALDKYLIKETKNGNPRRNSKSK